MVSLRKADLSDVVDVDDWFVDFALCSSREDFLFHIPTQFKVDPVGESTFALNFKADIIVGVNIGFKIGEIIYNRKVMTITNSLSLCRDASVRLLA